MYLNVCYQIKKNIKNLVQNTVLCIKTKIYKRYQQLIWREQQKELRIYQIKIKYRIFMSLLVRFLLSLNLSLKQLDLDSLYEVSVSSFIHAKFTASAKKSSDQICGLYIVFQVHLKINNHSVTWFPQFLVGFTQHFYSVSNQIE